ncbi:MAG: methyltransferase family protein [Nocardioidaceae bacterium]
MPATLSRSPARRLVAGVGLALATGMVLRRMSRDFNDNTTLRPSTSTLVYATYGAHGLATLAALWRPSHRVRLPRRAAASLGTAASVAGVGLFVAGARAFGTPDQLSGTQTGDLVTSGIYRWTRNPQYLGYLLLCGGTAMARRSTEAGVLTAVAASAFALWIRYEEDNLTRVFGDAYARYLSTTHRWLGPATAGRFNRSVQHQTDPMGLTVVHRRPRQGSSS